MTAHCARFVQIFLPCLCGCVLGRLLLFPGFLDPAAPSHDDLYRYFLISQAKWEATDWLTPRPLMIVFLHLLGGIIKTPTALWAVLSFTSVFFIATLLRFVERFFTAKLPPINIFFYALLIFSLPSSWEIHQLDYGGMLSGILCVVGLTVFATRLRTRAEADASLFIGPFLIYWLALETKPTFSILILAVSIVFAAHRRDTISTVAMVAVLLISVLVFLKDKFLHSPFVGAAGAGVYEVRISFSHNCSALTKYLTAAVPYPFLPGLSIIYAIGVINKRTRWITCLAPVLAVTAIAPMALIPNRVLTLYAWYASVFFLLPLVLLPLAVGMQRFAAAHNIAFVGIAALLAGHWWFTSCSEASSSYFYATSKYNRNVQDSLDVLRAKSPHLNTSPILISGLRGPSHAFRQQAYIKACSGLAEYTLLLRASERAWNTSARHLGNTAQLNELDVDAYDTFVVYGEQGTIRYMLSKEQVHAVPAAWREAVLFCGAALNYPDMPSVEIDRVMACFDHSAEYGAAIRLGDSPGVPERLGPVGLYHLARALIQTGDHARARAHLERALSQNDNANIRAALRSLEE